MTGTTTDFLLFMPAFLHPFFASYYSLTTRCINNFINTLASPDIF